MCFEEALGEEGLELGGGAGGEEELRLLTPSEEIDLGEEEAEEEEEDEDSWSATVFSTAGGWTGSLASRGWRSSELEESIMIFREGLGKG